MFEEQLVVINLYIPDKRFVLTLCPHASHAASHFTLAYRDYRLALAYRDYRFTIYYILILFMIYLSFEFTL